MIELKNLTKIYKLGRKKHLVAVDHVNLQIAKGQIVGIVGESGSGKSTLGKMMMGLIEPTSGEIFFEGKKKTTLMPKRFQMIFQDPYASLNPRMTIRAILEEPTLIHGLKTRVDELLDLVLLPKETKGCYPHELSGGQRQRVGIARAIALNPDVLICDEPISSLDVSIQAGIINLLQNLQKELGLTLIFIAHDLMMVRHLSSWIYVMHQGKIIEDGQTDQLFDRPRHCVTQLLLASISKAHL